MLSFQLFPPFLPGSFNSLQYTQVQTLTCTVSEVFTNNIELTDMKGFFSGNPLRMITHFSNSMHHYFVFSLW